MTIIKCLIVGDGNVGKTTFIQHYLTGKFEHLYLPTRGVEVSQIEFNSSNGKFQFNVWDTAGQEEYLGLQNAYYIDSNCAIIMFDLADQYSHNRILLWTKEIKKVVSDIPIVYVGNKYDKKMKTNDVKFPYISISAKTKYNIEKPFLQLIKLFDNNQ